MEFVTNQLYRDRIDVSNCLSPSARVITRNLPIESYMTYAVQKASLKRRIIGLYFLARFGYYPAVFWRSRVYFSFSDIVTL
jgi:hypothetical protein